eukprot:766826-Prymnesium_polylepis.2
MALGKQLSAYPKLWRVWLRIAPPPCRSARDQAHFGRLRVHRLQADPAQSGCHSMISASSAVRKRSVHRFPPQRHNSCEEIGMRRHQTSRADFVGSADTHSGCEWVCTTHASSLGPKGVRNPVPEIVTLSPPSVDAAVGEIDSGSAPSEYTKDSGMSTVYA